MPSDDVILCPDCRGDGSETDDSGGNVGVTRACSGCGGLGEVYGAPPPRGRECLRCQGCGQEDAHFACRPCCGTGVVWG